RIEPRSGLYLPDDEAGDCAVFARQLRRLCEEMGVQFRFGTQVSGLRVQGGQVQGLQVSSAGQAGPLACDAMVVAAGVDSHA
ncbi:FAD-dependent oxidoreductase, partial [Escherichia coli]|uniref:FAD-dependent oxidoreductase n=1 Tax=Escherichia coli TaxID=562 RepID=UPI0039DF3F9B